VNRLTRIRVVAAAVATLLTTSALFAQSEKVSIRMAPRPDQTVRLSMLQEMDFDVSFDGAAPPGAMPMKMVMRSTMRMTQRIGALKPDGSVDAQLSYDEVRVEMSMNGQTMPADAGNALAGKTIGVTYNRNGEIVDVKDVPGLGLTPDAFKQLMGSFMGNLPGTALAIGETTTAPLNMALPIPLPSLGQMNVTGNTTLTLASIDKDAQGRSARFDSVVDGKMVSDLPSPDGQGKASLSFTIGGNGTTVMDLDRGVVRSSLSTSTFDGKVNVAGAVGLPGMNMRGTIKVTVTSQGQ
jgi:hypothetical protein